MSCVSMQKAETLLFLRLSKLPCAMLAVGLALLFMVSQSAFAQEDECSAWSAYGAHKYQTIDDYKGDPKNLEKWANKGDAEAAFQLGYNYQELAFQKGKGRIVSNAPKDPETTKFWYHKAADLGYHNPAGESCAGLFYLRGIYIQDDTEALFWLNRAIQDGSVFALNTMAEYKRKHPGESGDAMALTRAAADRGDVPAQILLGKAYLTGDGVSKDIALADAWFSKADAGTNRAAHADDAAFNEATIGDAYLDAGETAKGLDYLLHSAQSPPYYDQGQNAIYSQSQQGALKQLAQIYHEGKLVPQNEEYAQTCLNAAQALANQSAAQDAANAAQDQANAERNRAEINARITGALTDLTNSVGSLNTPSPIQQTANAQLANIAAAQTRAQQAQAAKPQQTASAQFTLPSRTAQTRPAVTASSGTAPPPTPNPRLPTSIGVTLDVLCPPSGFVPDVMTHPSPDVALGIPCTPGSAIYINGVPQFNTAGTGLGPVTRAGSGGSNSGGPGGSGSGPGSSGGGAGCQNVNSLVLVESQWFQADIADKEVVAFVTNRSNSKVTCTVAFDGGGQWVDYGTGTYNVGDTHKGGQGGGLWHMGAASSNVKYQCYAGADPTDTSGHLCNPNLTFPYP